MSKKKTIAVAIVLALILIIGGMLAYFTDTDTRTNVFTLGDEVEISLSETGWTNSTGTNYTLAAAQGVHPGTTVAKDPTINNESTTTPAYVFAEIIVPCYDADGDNYSRSCNVGWKLYDQSNNVVDSGTFYSSKISVGEVFRESASYANQLNVGTYTLELLDVR